MRATMIWIIFSCLGCVNPDVPKDIWIDDRFTVHEELVIREGMATWEEQTGRHLFEYRGRILVDEFKKEDLQDDLHVVYKVEIIRGDAKEIFDHASVWGERNGWATSADILIFVDNDEKALEEADWLWDLFETSMHELGHNLWLSHIADTRAIMHPGGYFLRCATSLDLEAFCSIYSCENNYSPARAEAECFRRHGNILDLSSIIDFDE